MSNFEHFPKLMELVEGKKQDDKVLGFVDLCGTKVFIQKYLKDEIGNMQRTLTVLQTSFSSALLNVAKDNQNLSIIQASDGAFIEGSADDVLAGIMKVISLTPFIMFSGKDIRPVPMRGAIADGLIQVFESDEVKNIKNFNGFPFWGPAFVKTYLMEKKGQKGINIFITESVKNKLKEQSHKDSVIEKTQTSNVDVYGESGETVFLVNWCKLLPEFVDDYLEKSMPEHYDPKGEYGIKTLAFFLKAAEQWKSSEDESLQQMGSHMYELRDLI